MPIYEAPRKPMSRRLIQHDLPFEPPTAVQLMTAGELYAAANEFLLHELKEDRRLERKTVGVHAEKLGEYFCMWANTPPDGGLIAVGVEDDGQISGCLKAGTAHINNLERSGRNFCPDARYEVKRLDVHRVDGERDYVLLFRVYYRSEPKVVRTTRRQLASLEESVRATKSEGDTKRKTAEGYTARFRVVLFP